MQLASTAIGGVAGGGSGAAAALNGQLYNEQLHPDLFKGLMAKVNDFAKESGLSPEEAQNRLLLEAMRLQDSGKNLGLSTNQIGGSSGVPDDAVARAFLEK
ncbi:hypothetical protein, partial [Frateuria defendens]|uniref:hypothetical protein n=1 Tax=Frateuria defendens TaxID=2219559 RepID=UPI001292D81A